jgi:hypothetical protein
MESESHETSSHIHLICPHCSTENRVENADHIKCTECERSFEGHTYKRFRKPFVSASAALVIGLYGGYKVETQFFDEERYPVTVEYEIIDSCVNSTSALMDSVLRRKKTEVCACALEKTMKDVSFHQMEGSGSDFLTHFRNNVSLCS